MTAQACSRGHVDDVPLRLEQVGKCVPTHQERTRQVDANDLVPVIQCGESEVLELQDASDIAQHIDPPKLVHGGLNDLCHRRL